MSGPAQLGLGTVQFGLRYGAAAAPIPAAEVGRLLRRAAAGGVTVLDTAPAYGDSERVLGEQLAALHGFRVVTKTAPGAADVVAQLRASLRRLRVDAVDGLLVHVASDLLGPRGAAVWTALCEARAAGLVQKIGVSVYHPQQADEVLERYAVDMIQAPFNVFDQRLQSSGLLRRLRARGVEVHARSVFLQGVLLMRPEDLPPHLAGLRVPLLRFRDAARTVGQEPLHAALGFVRATPGVDVALVGVDTPEHLEQILAAPAVGVERAAFEALAQHDERQLDPSKWPSPRGKAP